MVNGGQDGLLRVRISGIAGKAKAILFAIFWCRVERHTTSPRPRVPTYGDSLGVRDAQKRVDELGMLPSYI